jgi:hypothetical protein
MELNKKQTHIVSLYAVIILLITAFSIQRCHFEGKVLDKNNIEVTIPEKSGEFDKITPKEIQYDTVYSKTVIYNNKEIKVANPFNKDMLDKYIAAKDSLEQIKLYLSAIEIRRYKEVFDNDDIKITVEAETTGKLNWMKPEYTIKERTIIVPVKKTVFAVYAGGGAKSNVLLNELSPTINLGIQGKKGSIISAQYGLDQSIQLNYSFKILDIKK